MPGILISVMALATFAWAAPDMEPDQGLSVSQMVERINERYDDFFKYHRHLEERWERLKIGADERKKMVREHHKKIEIARQEYVKSRRARPSDEPLRLKWEQEQKNRQEQIEMLRQRYVQKRDTVEQYLKKGRQIPGLKEFGLEDY